VRNWTGTDGRAGVHQFREVCAAWVKISTTADGDDSPARWSGSATSKPLSPPRLTSTSVTSGGNYSKRRSASALVDATPTTVSDSG
jgi:hypothetical protein